MEDNPNFELIFNKNLIGRDQCPEKCPTPKIWIVKQNSDSQRMRRSSASARLGLKINFAH